MYSSTQPEVESGSLPDGAYQVVSQPLVWFRPADPADLDAVHKLEEMSYPADEAATREKLDYRLNHAANAFLIAVSAGSSTAAGERIVGFTCGTCAHGSKLTHASMSHHEPDGNLLCIHSVVVAPDCRRTGIATRMLKAYLTYVQGTTPGLSSVRLLCKDNLIKLYEGAGFSLLGPSDVVHGQDLWYEMRYDLEVVDQSNE